MASPVGLAIATSSNRSTTPVNCGYKECCWFWFGLVVYIALMAVLYPISIRVVSKRPPQFQVESVTVYPFNISSSHHITANWDLIFSVTNPGKISRFKPYKNVQVSVLHKDIIISSAPVEPSWLDKYVRQGLVLAHVAASSVHMEESVAEDIVSEWKKGAVKFNFRLNAHVWFHGQHKQMIVECKKVKIDFMSPTNRTVGNLLRRNSPTECWVHIYGLESGSGGVDSMCLEKV